MLESIRTSQTPWSKAVDITLPGANEKIAKLGEQALQVPFNPEDPEGLKVTLNIIDKKLLSCLKRIYEN